jgi:predicted metal-binding membrane protein
MSPRADIGERTGIPPVRWWTRAELALSGVLLAIAAVAWVLTHQLSEPGMQTGILTGSGPMNDAMPEPMDAMRPPALALVLFLGTWTVMMAAMMLPSIVPFTIGISRLLRASGARRGRLTGLTFSYFLIWIGTGVAAYLVLRGFELIAGGPETRARVGAAVLLAAGAYQLTPLKRVCLRHCRSPVLLVMQHGQAALRSLFGAARAGLAHGCYCLGCCWALMAVLLAAGVMSLTWMAIIAAIVAMEKWHRHGELISRVLGGLFLAAGLTLLVAPAALLAMS